MAGCFMCFLTKSNDRVLFTLPYELRDDLKGANNYYLFFAFISLLLLLPLTYIMLNV